MWGEVFSFLLPLYPKSATIARFPCPYQVFIMNLQAKICVHDCFPFFLYKGYHTSHSVLGSFVLVFLMSQSILDCQSHLYVPNADILSVVGLVLLYTFHPIKKK